MTDYRGNLDGIYRGRLKGWVINTKDITERPNIIVLLNDQVVAVSRADQDRADLRHLGLSDTTHGFDIDLTTWLMGPAAESIEISVLAGATGWSLPGTPFKYVASASGFLDYWYAGSLVGWAHGAGYSRTRLEILRNGKLLLAWPADLYRVDLDRLGIGDGRHGFSVPVHMLVPGGLEDLTFRIEGTDRVLKPPTLERPDASAIPATLADGFASAGEARQALLDGINPNGDGAARDSVRLSFAAFQTLLNELSYAAGRKDDEEARVNLKLRAGLSKPSSPRKVANKALTQLSRILKRAQQHAGEDRAVRIREHISNELLPYYAANRISQNVMDAAVFNVDDPEVLAAVVEVFRAKNHLSVAAVTFHAFLSRNPAPSWRQLHQLRQMSSWATCIDFKDIPEARAPDSRSRNRRVLYTTWSSLPYDQNGYCTRTHYLLRAFQQLGETVVGVTRLGYPWDNANKAVPASQIETIDGVTYVHLGGERASRRVMTLHAYIDECADRIAQIATLLRADVIHSASNWMVGLPALIAARRSGLPFCYEMRGVWEITRASNIAGYDQTDHFKLFHSMEGLVAREADAVMAITSQVRGEMQRRGVDASKIRLASNGVDIEQFFPRPKDAELMQQLGLGDEIVFGFIGSFAPYEGLIDICQAALRLRDRGIRFKMLLVGDGEAFAEVKSFRDRHGLADHVLMTGRVSFTDVPRYYSVMDVSLCPRIPVPITEIVSPLKPFEAMAMAKPVVGSDVAAVAEIIDHGRTGWLFRKGDLDSLVELLAMLANDPGSIADAGVAARAFVEQHHQWKMIAHKIVAVWDTLRA